MTANGSDGMHVIYYAPTIPPVETTARYVHAHRLGVHAETAALITDTAPPDKIKAVYDEVHIVDSDEILHEVYAALNIIRAARREQATSPLLVTTFHYAKAVTGFLTNVPWVVDVYDDPRQYVYNSPNSHHRFTMPVLKRVLARADRHVYAIHPATPGLKGDDRRYNLYGDGCPVSIIEPDIEFEERTLHGVWAGSPRMDRGLDIFIDALAHPGAPTDFTIDVFGEPYADAEQYANQRGVNDLLTFHGRQPHNYLQNAIASAHFGLCILPPRPDWKYSFTIKVREYLAGGTVPIVSNFPGLRQIVGDAGLYVDPTPTAIVDGLQYLADLDMEDLKRLCTLVRQRAEAIPMNTWGDLFAKMVLDRDDIRYRSVPDSS